MTEPEQQEHTSQSVASPFAPPAASAGQGAGSLPLPDEAGTIDLSAAERDVQTQWQQATPPYPPAVTPPGHPEATPSAGGVDVLAEPSAASGLFSRFVPHADGLDSKLATVKSPRRIRNSKSLPVVELVGEDSDDDMVDYVPLSAKLKPYVTTRNVAIVASVVVAGLLATVIARNIDLSDTLATTENPTTTLPPTTFVAAPVTTMPFAEAVQSAQASSIGTPAPTPGDAALAFGSALQYRNADLAVAVLSPTANRAAVVATAEALTPQISAVVLSPQSFVCTVSGTTAQCAFAPATGVTAPPLRLEQVNGAWRIVG